MVADGISFVVRYLKLLLGDLPSIYLKIDKVPMNGNGAVARGAPTAASSTVGIYQADTPMVLLLAFEAKALDQLVFILAARRAGIERQEEKTGRRRQ
jgi:hypothetical protein